MKVDKVLNDVLIKITPENSEINKINEETSKFIKDLAEIGLNANVGGSLAKNTMIKKEKQDIDIFVVFENEEQTKTLGQKLHSKYRNVEEIHGSRDYFRINKEHFVFEIIPVTKFSKPENANNVTDFSLIHVDYIKKEIKKNKNLSNEIRLAKAFCHAQNCYGAESYIGGFSGYSLEVLMCYYGSFINFLKKISKEEIIDPKKYFKNKQEIKTELNESKLSSPIILIDPTYKYRNVCAGLRKETFEIFIEAAKKFLKNPSEDFFKKKEFILNNFKTHTKKAKAVVYQISITTDRQEGDIAATKMKKFFEFIKSEIKRKEQEIIDSQFIYTEGKNATGYLAIKEKKEIEIIGPSIKMQEAIKQFKKVRKKVYTKKGFVCAKEKIEISKILNNQNFVAESMGVGFTFKKL